MPAPDGTPAYTAEEGIGFYVQEGPVVFSRPWYRKIPGWNLIEERYPSGPIDGVLLSYFGETRLKEALTDVIITAYDIEGRSPFFFKSRHAKDPSRPEDDFFMRDAARATSAAPTYFEPAKIETPGDPPYLALIDGGVYAINPAMCAYAEVRYVYPPDRQVLLVSLGTGENTDPLPYDEVKGWGEALVGASDPRRRLRRQQRYRRLPAPPAPARSRPPPLLPLPDEARRRQRCHGRRQRGEPAGAPGSRREAGRGQPGGAGRALRAAGGVGRRPSMWQGT